MLREQDWLKEVAKTSLHGCLMYFFKKNPKYKLDAMDVVAVLHFIANEYAKRVQNPSQYE